MKNLFFLLFLLPFFSMAQPNCNTYLYDGDTLQYKACLHVENIEAYQFSKEFHDKFDEAIAICPHFAYAYREKSTAYLKSGDFLTWKKIIDKAVEYDYKENLPYRAWCRYQFFRDYKGAIKDIERLDSLVKYDIGYGINGDYHLNITKAMCYSALGQKEKAKDIIEKQLNTENYSPSLFDYYQLGVTYYEIGNLEKALKCFEKQSEINELADNAYYKSKIYKEQKKEDQYEKYKEEALALYAENKKLKDPYTHHFNKVFLETIEQE